MKNPFRIDLRWRQEDKIFICHGGFVRSERRRRLSAGGELVQILLVNWGMVQIRCNKPLPIMWFQVTCRVDRQSFPVSLRVASVDSGEGW